jgi:mannosyl-3-phosphoglycerate phosphatase
MYVVFTDLDGTLLDHHTYSYQLARPALEILFEKGYPLVICTSKTRAEIESFRAELDIRDPFISENGGAIFVPQGYFTGPFGFDKVVDSYRVIELGTDYHKIRRALKESERRSGCKATGFGDLTAEEISRETGLDIRSAELSKQREYDEAFTVPDRECVSRLLEQIKEKGLNFTRGGRYFHIMGNNDKGQAVLMLTEIFRRQYDHVVTIGLGDSDNDLPMLRAVDMPILVQKPGGSYATVEEGFRLAKGIGPAGWNSALLKILK